MPHEVTKKCDTRLQKYPQVTKVPYEVTKMPYEVTKDPYKSYKNANPSLSVSVIGTNSAKINV